MRRFLLGLVLLGLFTCLHAVPARAQSAEDAFVPDLSALADDVFTLVNQERQARHRRVLPRHPGVEIAADLLAGDVGGGAQLTQSRIDSRLSLAGYPPRVSAAVFAWVINFQYLSPSDAARLPELIVDAWLQHRVTRGFILNKRVRHAGIGASFSGVGDLVVVMALAAPARKPPPIPEPPKYPALRTTDPQGKQPVSRLLFQTPRADGVVFHEQQFGIQNIGDADAKVRIADTPTNGDKPFKITKVSKNKDNNGEITVKPAELILVTVRYTPRLNNQGDNGAWDRIPIDLTNDRFNTHQYMGLIGLVANKPIPQLPAIHINPIRLTLPTHKVNAARPKKATAVLTNTGQKDLTYTITGPVLGDKSFSLVGAKNGKITGKLAPGKSLTITVNFTPDAAGVHEDYLTITTNDPFVPDYNLGMVGVGVP